MSTSPRKRPATYEDVLALPPHVTGQIVDGELFATPRPANPHATASSTLGMDLGSASQRGRGGPGGWWIVDPEARTLEVYRLSEGRWVLLSAHEGTESVRAEPFEELEVVLSDLWVEREPKL